MDSYDNVKAEKANAIARYRRFRNLAKLLQLIEVFVALTLISWSWTRLPAAMSIAAHALSHFSVYFLNSHFIFLIGNVIVIALFVLSRHYEAGDNSNSSDVYEDYLSNAESFPSVTGSDSELPAAEIVAQKQPVVKLDEQRKSPDVVVEKEPIIKQDKQIVCEKVDCKVQCEEAVTTAIEKATKQIQKFQRTQSAKMRCEIGVKPRPELRRSETERRKVFSNEENKRQPSETSVESLSNEEFRLTIEAFIAKQQKFIWAQKIAEIEN